MKYLVFSMALILSTHAFSQHISNDRCEDALPIQIGETLEQQSNQEATVTVEEQPDGYPITCIKTFENDLWYGFVTEDGYAFYEVRINPIQCNSLAGLQAMIIQIDSCYPDTYKYRDCANPYAEELILMELVEATPGQEMRIYIDGFDGTACGFEVSLKGYKDNPYASRPSRRSRYDYTRPETFYEPEEATVVFMNNEANIQWTASSTEDIDYFLVQKIYWPNDTAHTFGRTIGKVDPVNTTSGDQLIEYEFNRIQAFKNEEEYCYRVVKVGIDGEKSYTDQFCNLAQLNEDLFVSEVEKSRDQDVYYIQFINRRKQDLFFTLFDDKMQEMKGLTRPKEPKGDDRITIDMKAYQPGYYYLRVQGKEEFYLRKFYRE